MKISILKLISIRMSIKINVQNKSNENHLLVDNETKFIVNQVNLIIY